MVHVMLFHAEETYHIHKNSKWGRTCGEHEISVTGRIEFGVSQQQPQLTKKSLCSFNSMHERKNYTVLLITLKHILKHSTCTRRCRHIIL
jgi:hypothetical protein